MSINDPDGMYLQVNLLLDERRAEAAQQRLADRLRTPSRGLRRTLAAILRSVAGRLASQPTTASRVQAHAAR